MHECLCVYLKHLEPVCVDMCAWNTKHIFYFPADLADLGTRLFSPITKNRTSHTNNCAAHFNLEDEEKMKKKN